MMPGSSDSPCTTVCSHVQCGILRLAKKHAFIKKQREQEPVEGPWNNIENPNHYGILIIYICEDRKLNQEQQGSQSVISAADFVQMKYIAFLSMAGALPADFRYAGPLSRFH
jgi:hypothetical protein